MSLQVTVLSPSLPPGGRLTGGYSGSRLSYGLASDFAVLRANRDGWRRLRPDVTISVLPFRGKLGCQGKRQLR